MSAFEPEEQLIYCCISLKKLILNQNEGLFFSQCIVTPIHFYKPYGMGLECTCRIQILLRYEGIQLSNATKQFHLYLKLKKDAIRFQVTD